jgi:uncharacterized protein
VKAVADTNVLVSGLIWKGPSAFILDRGALRLFGLIASEEILAELEAVLSRPHLAEKLRARGRTVAEVMRTYRAVATVVEPAALEFPAALRDPKDLPVLSCAVSAKADVIISGDKDLLVLQEFAGIPILTPRQFLTSIGM